MIVITETHQMNGEWHCERSDGYCGRGQTAELAELDAIMRRVNDLYLERVQNAAGNS